MESPARTVAIPVALLRLSNVFMPFAWYGHPKHPVGVRPVRRPAHEPAADVGYLWAGLGPCGAAYFMFRE